MYYRCTFHGTNEELDAHLIVPDAYETGPCHFELMKEFLSTYEAQIEALDNSVQRKDEQISALTAMIGKLSHRVDALENTMSIKFGKDVNKIIHFNPGTLMFSRCMFSHVWMFFATMLFVKKKTFVLHQQNQFNSISFYCNYKTIFLIVFLSYNKQQYFMTNLLLLNVSVKC